jgi:hypothetical protein
MKLELSKQSFWDIDIKSIEGKEVNYATWIIKRIAHGTIDNMVSIDVYYGRKRIQRVLNSMSQNEKEKARLMTMLVF